MNKSTRCVQADHTAGNGQPASPVAPNIPSIDLELDVTDVLTYSSAHWYAGRKPLQHSILIPPRCSDMRLHKMQMQQLKAQKFAASLSKHVMS